MGRLGIEETDCECGPREGIKTRRDGTNEEQMFSSKHSGCIWDPGFLSKREISTAPLDTHTHTHTHRGHISSSHMTGTIISNIFKNGQTMSTQAKSSAIPGSKLGHDSEKRKLGKKHS